MTVYRLKLNTYEADSKRFLDSMHIGIFTSRKEAEAAKSILEARARQAQAATNLEKVAYIIIEKTITADMV